MPNKRLKLNWVFEFFRLCVLGLRLPTSVAFCSSFAHSMIISCAFSLVSLPSLSSYSLLSDTKGASLRSWGHKISQLRLIFFQYRHTQAHPSHIDRCVYQPCQRDGVHRPTPGSASCSPRDCARYAGLNSWPLSHRFLPLDQFCPSKTQDDTLSDNVIHPWKNEITCYYVN